MPEIRCVYEFSLGKGGNLKVKFYLFSHKYEPYSNFETKTKFPVICCEI